MSKKKITTGARLDDDGYPTAQGSLRDIILAAAREAGTTLDEQTVLSGSRDPYRCDTPAGRRDGAWFAQQLPPGDDPLHLRALHYWISSRGNVLKPNGKVYVNTDADWIWMSEVAAKCARWNGYIDFDRIIDNRNAAPIIWLPDYRDPELGLRVGLDIKVPDAKDLLPRPFIDHVLRQPNYVCIIAEKASLRTILEPIVEEIGGGFYSPTGEPSETMIHRMAQHAYLADLPLVVLYVSDFDPSGFQMPISVARKLQGHRDLFFPDLEWAVHRVALTLEQCTRFDLPSTPLKDSERRGDRWREAMGREQTEVDAMLALQPEALAEIARQAVAPFVDPTLEERTEAAVEVWEAKAAKAIDEQLSAEERERLQVEATGKLDELKERLTELENTMRLDASRFVLPEFKAPTANLPDGDQVPDPLCSSEDSWTEATRKLRNAKRYAGLSDTD